MLFMLLLSSVADVYTTWKTLAINQQRHLEQTISYELSGANDFAFPTREFALLEMCMRSSWSWSDWNKVT